MIKIKKNEDYTKILRLLDPDTQDPIDLTDVTAFCEMRDVPGGTLAATAVCTVTPSTGTIKVYFSAAQTSALEPGEYGYDVWIVENSQKHPLYTTRVKIEEAYTENFGGA